MNASIEGANLISRLPDLNVRLNKTQSATAVCQDGIFAMGRHSAERRYLINVIEFAVCSWLSVCELLHALTQFAVRTNCRSGRLSDAAAVTGSTVVRCAPACGGIAKPDDVPAG
jgi:hypothetical protein